MAGPSQTAVPMKAAATVATTVATLCCCDQGYEVPILGPTGSHVWPRTDRCRVCLLPYERHKDVFAHSCLSWASARGGIVTAPRLAVPKDLLNTVGMWRRHGSAGAIWSSSSCALSRADPFPLRHAIARRVR